MHDSGAKIFLRFASEMNGDWTRYSKSPSEYRRKFRLVHKVMKKYAPNVATVWCPYTFPRTNLPSYYPGDDGTDWVGVNMYNVTFHNNDLKAPAFQEHPCDLLNQVYRLYSKRKPVMICEYGVTHFSKAENKQRPDYAILKLLTLYKAIPKLYPRVKCINYFDGNAIAYAGDRASNDYCVTNNAQVMSAYQSAISQPFYLTQPQGEDALAPSVPTHLRDGQRLTGKVKLSCYARAPSDRVAVQFIVDHKKIHSALNAGKWDFEWDTSTVSPGRHRLKLRVMETKNWETVLWKFVDIYTGEVQTSKLLE